MSKPCGQLVPLRPCLAISARLSHHDVVRLALGLLLLAAAVLKLTTEPAAVASIWGHRWVQLGIADVELALGALLVMGIMPAAAHVAGLAWFSCTAGISLAKALLGEQSCGCFGAAPVPPWASLVMSVGALGALLLTVPQCARRQDASRNVRWATLSVLVLVLGTVTVWRVATSGRSELTLDGEILGSAKTVDLHPERWPGRRLPLLRHIEADASLGEGDWLIGFVEPGCANCDELTARYEQLADHWASGHGFPKVAVVDVGPRSSDELSSRPNASRVARGRLSPDRRWEIALPLQVRLRDGQVSAITLREGLGY